MKLKNKYREEDRNRENREKRRKKLENERNKRKKVIEFSVGYGRRSPFPSPLANIRIEESLGSISAPPSGPSGLVIEPKESPIRLCFIAWCLDRRLSYSSRQCRRRLSVTQRVSANEIAPSIKGGLNLNLNEI